MLAEEGVVPLVISVDSESADVQHHCSGMARSSGSTNAFRGSFLLWLSRILRIRVKWSEAVSVNSDVDRKFGVSRPVNADMSVACLRRSTARWPLSRWVPAMDCDLLTLR